MMHHEIIKRSPNCSPRNGIPDMVVIHSMGEYIKDETGRGVHAPDFLLGMNLSAHILIEPDGKILRLVNDDHVAWHAKGFNKGSLGIEFLVEGVHNYETFLEAIEGDWLTQAQYYTGIGVVRDWIGLYSIPDGRLFRHSDLSPGRKRDPGEGFPWGNFVIECYRGMN